jgi:DNA replication initiation complex subunit (GINS family)
MYEELYAAWQQETREDSLSKLPSDFYAKLAVYLKKITEEISKLDKSPLKTQLLEHEQTHVRRMLKDLLRLRYKKIVKSTSKTQKLPFEMFAVEEAKIFENLTPFADAYQKFETSLLQGQVSKVEVAAVHKRVTLRFSKNVPAIIGADMKTFGPFLVEDIASLPLDNARILVKQGLAELVEVS